MGGGEEEASVPAPDFGHLGWEQVPVSTGHLSSSPWML